MLLILPSRGGDAERDSRLDYMVWLHFAEIDASVTAARRRVFDVHKFTVLFMDFYEGRWMRNLQEGFEGVWENGVPKVIGVFTWPDGSTYAGCWSWDVMIMGKRDGAEVMRDGRVSLDLDGGRIRAFGV
ncbi:hypothetical protein Scep_007804 [Stephania cephalantha]|uniref:Uncharacterized protein n=1 Tax=Stephania cephalantha TaxID=152367 RepID=A0AAP0PM48_9MAGN